MQKQAGYIPGAPQNANRLKQGKLTSSFFGEKSGNRLTQQAFQKGNPVLGRSNVREHDFWGVYRNWAEWWHAIKSPCASRFQGPHSWTSFGAGEVLIVVMGNKRRFLEVVERNYKSLSQPDFSFVNKAISSRPYGLLVAKLHNLFEVEELTDSNDDISFRYVVSKLNNQRIIELSMLGRYAAVSRISRSGRTELVSPNTTVTEEVDIISVLLEGQIEILRKYELEQSVALNLFNAEPENVCLYQALFADVDVLPWESVASNER